MKITSKVLSLPPYLSTTWKNISSLHIREELGSFTLIVVLQNRVQVEVPKLDKSTVDSIFEAHARSAEEEPNSMIPLENPFSFSLPLKGGESGSSLGFAMQHNPEQSDLPPVSPDILKKIAAVAKAFGLEDFSNLPKAEVNCNCFYCQVSRVLHGEENVQEIEVSDEDLKFKSWDVKQSADKLYIVTNPLDVNEHYNVFLGEPLGCTCGQKNCEHIRAVLNT